MWSYYGSKSKVVDSYPQPKYDNIIEPFAGSARYSLKWFDRDVTIVDKYEKLIKIWRWLQKCSPNDILSLPELKKGETIDSYNFDCEEAKWLTGFIIQGGVNAPRKTASLYGHKMTAIEKKRIAKNIFKIKHWNILMGSYEDLPDKKATWFIDPPYQFGGEYYVESNKNIDYAKLSHWCMSRSGQVIVCENTKANWLDFKPMKDMQGSMYKTTEAIWSNIPTNYDNVQQTLFKMNT